MRSLPIVRQTTYYFYCVALNSVCNAISGNCGRFSSGNPGQLQSSAIKPSGWASACGAKRHRRLFAVRGECRVSGAFRACGLCTIFPSVWAGPERKSVSRSCAETGPRRLSVDRHTGAWPDKPTFDGMCAGRSVGWGRRGGGRGRALMRNVPALISAARKGPGHLGPRRARARGARAHYCGEDQFMTLGRNRIRSGKSTMRATITTSPTRKGATPLKTLCREMSGRMPLTT